MRLALLARLVLVPTAIDPCLTTTTESEILASSLARFVLIFSFSRIPLRILKGAFGFSMACPLRRAVFS